VNKFINELKKCNYNNIKMSRFPLYDNLSQGIKNRDLTVLQKKDFIVKIKEIDTDGYELIYALIKMYQMETGDANTSFTLPYKGIFIDENIKFDLNDLPKKLKQILYKFVDIHLDKMSEEDSIKSQTPVDRV